MKAIFRGLTGRAEAAPAVLAPIIASDTRRRLELLEDFEAAGIGWLWASDARSRLAVRSRYFATRIPSEDATATDSGSSACLWRERLTSGGTMGAGFAT